MSFSPNQPIPPNNFLSTVPSSPSNQTIPLLNKPKLHVGGLIGDTPIQSQYNTPHLDSLVAAYLQQIKMAQPQTQLAHPTYYQPPAAEIKIKKFDKRWIALIVIIVLTLVAIFVFKWWSNKNKKISDEKMKSKESNGQESSYEAYLEELEKPHLNGYHYKNMQHYSPPAYNNTEQQQYQEPYYEEPYTPHYREDESHNMQTEVSDMKPEELTLDDMPDSIRSQLPEANEKE